MASLSKNNAKKLVPERAVAEKLAAEVAGAIHVAHPHQWMIDHLGFRKDSLKWSIHPAYARHKWDGDTDPLVRMCDNVAQFRWTAVESGVSTGKTITAAGLLMWFLWRWKNSRVISVAPKEEQLTLGLWRELQVLWQRFPIGELQSLRLRMEPPLDVWAAVGMGAGISREEVEGTARKAHGLHAEHMLILVEEAPGVHPALMNALANTCSSPGNVILALGNPDSETDTLHRFAKRANVDVIRISGYDHPNVVANDPKIAPGAQTKIGLGRLESGYGKGHRLYLSRARGICPGEAADSLIHWDWCVEAKNRGTVIHPDPAIPVAIGADVANSQDGDYAAVARGRGSVLEEVSAFPCPNSNKLGEQLHVLATSLGTPDEQIGVDGVGVGAGTVNELLRLGRQVLNIQSSAAQIELYTEHGYRMAEQFRNIRSQMWWLMRLDLQFGDASRIVLPDDEELFADLCTPRFRMRSGKIEVETKEETKKRLGRSPNKGDAAVYWNFTRKRFSAAAADAGVQDEDEKKEMAEAAEARRGDIGQGFGRVPGGARRRRMW